ncbi:zinc finger C2HC domain-containing protein 1C [Anolis carolinensis]|uniref:zinc finger C2HC domain-containing protein 1C n=1 Tax=Anolis carolinensis TaxID=28377 RepID=UPI002F2B725A
MAQLQLTAYSPMDPTACNPGLPGTSQERCHSEALKEQSQLEHLRTNIQQQLLCSKDKKQVDLHIQKGHKSSCSQPAERTRLILEKAGFYSAGPCNWYFKGQAGTLPSHWRTKRREGVDRAYPLKPVFHHEAGNANLPSSSARETPSSGTSSEKKGRLNTVKVQHGRMRAPSVEESKKTASHPQWAESGYIQKLEAAGRSLEEEIQRKEAILREKLRRTEDELRRIQWERQQAEAEARRERGALWVPERKAAGMAQGSFSRFTTQPRTCQKAYVSESSMVSVGTVRLSQPQHIEKLKKQRLVASNSKIREHTPNCSPELTPVHDLAISVATPLGQISHLAAEPLHTEAPSNVEEWGECRICGRRLYRSRLEKHVSICSKNHSSKRKVFDSSKARAKGTELETYHLLKGSDISQKKASNQCSDASKKIGDISKQSNWRQKHESFIKTLRRAREVQRVISKGGKASDLPPIPAMENPDYKLCPYCTRQFAPKVAERHIPKCKNIKNRPPPPQQKKQC